MMLAPLPAARASARIDTLVLRVELPGPLHSATLHDRLAAEIGSTITVKPDNDIGSLKTVRVQDPTPARLALLIERFGQATEIERLDIAIDWRLARRPGRTHNETSAALDELTTGLARSFAPPAEDLAGAGRPRQADRETGQVHVLHRKDDWPPQISPTGGTVYFGSPLGGTCWRVYRKLKDEGQPVPLAQQHSRVEMQIEGDGLARAGLSDLASLADLDFADLAFGFKFVAIAAPPLIPGTLGRIIHRRLLDYRPHHLAAGAWSMPAQQRVTIKALNDAARSALSRLSAEYAQGNFSRNLEMKEARQSAVSGGLRYSYQSHNSSSSAQNTRTDQSDGHPARPISLTGSPCSPVADHEAEAFHDGLAMLAPVKPGRWEEGGG